MRGRWFLVAVIAAASLFLGGAPAERSEESFAVAGRVTAVKLPLAGESVVYAPPAGWKDAQVQLLGQGPVEGVLEANLAARGAFSFPKVRSGTYVLQIVAPGFIVHKTTLVVGKERAEMNAALDLKLERPIDLGVGEALREGAGSLHAFGCVNTSLVFVQWQGSNTWTQAQITTTETAAGNGMQAFAAQAPRGARITSPVENLGTFTVTSAVGNTCGEADLWVDEVLQQLGLTVGSLDSRLTALSNARRDAACGTSPRCAACGLQSSSFLFFITRDDSTMWGGWNCNNRYLISYWNRRSDQQVYIHETGHAFGAQDEYCVPNQNYCCGWVTGSWGCTPASGCLGQTNDNCDPACGTMCGAVDCQDGCPAANCTSHTPCAMGGAALAYCPATLRQIGWADSDGDLAPDCLETNCGTSPGDPTSVPSCFNAQPVAVAGPVPAPECVAGQAIVTLDGAGSSDLDGDSLTCAWSSTTCSIVNPAHCVTSATCPLGSNVVRLVVDDGIEESAPSYVPIQVQDTLPPVVAAPPPLRLECTGSAGVPASDPRIQSWLDAASAGDLCHGPIATVSNDAPLSFPSGCGAGLATTVSFSAVDPSLHVGSASSSISVFDGTPPAGHITDPPEGTCFGPGEIPAVVTDDFSDVCDAVHRSYDPPVGPAYSDHGDYHVVLTASDGCANAATDDVSFTIDLVPPVVQILSPANDQTGLPPVTIPIRVVFASGDDDGAAGGVVHEVVKLMDSCVLFDGDTYGDRDGLLSDEGLQITKFMLCHAMARCGLLILREPFILVEATDQCGGNTGTATRILRKRLLKTEVCSP